MKLFLSSEAKHPESMRKLETFVNGFEGKRIAYIPTAANGEEPFGTWKTGKTWNLVNTLGAEVTPMLLEDYTKTNFPGSLKDKDIIWMAGGMCGYLMYWIRRTQLDNYLVELLDNGLIYVGSSAGSMITAKTLYPACIPLNEPEIGAEVIPGLGLVDFDFYPHFEEEMFEPLKKVYKGNKMYLVKNGDVITICDGILKILGKERVIENL
ncbi:MAG: Type 1 glutamine amidotransferase-like domain-containing protein [Patescibacteria group bacterium]